MSGEDILVRLQWLTTSNYFGWQEDAQKALRDCAEEIKKLREEKACWRETAEEFAEDVGDIELAAMSYREIQRMYKKAVERLREDGKNNDYR